MEIEIREFNKEDKPLVEAFYAEMGGESKFFFNATGYSYHCAMSFFTDEPEKNMVHWIAVLDGRMVGYVFVWNANHKIVELGIGVADDLKGKHLGGELIDTVKRWCAEHGKGGILLTTHPANTRGQMLYRRCGFKFMGISQNDGEFLFLYNMLDEK